MLKACAAVLLTAAAFACSACSAPADDSASASSSASAVALDPPRLQVTSPLALEPVDDATMVITESAIVGNPNVETQTVTYWGALVLLDKSGAAARVEPVKGRCSVAGGGTHAIEAKVALTREQLGSVSSIRLVCGYAGKGGARAFIETPPRNIAGMARRFFEAEAKRIEQERLDAWYARFPIGDYSNTTIIGDSISQNATSSLLAALPGITVNADAGRTLEEGGLVFEGTSPDAGVLDHVRNDEGAFARYVIQTGNNDVGGVPIEAVEEIVACLGPDKEIYFVTEMMTGNVYGMDTTNAAIADAVARYPNVHAIDWHGLVEGHESEYLADYCHPRRDREPDFANCIKEGLDVPYPR